MKIKFTAILPYLLLTILISIPIFGHLDTLPFRIWDEARPAMNAYEMYKNHQYWVTHFEGKPEMWQTKPPLLIWLQVFFSHLLGFGELAIRLPSAIAGFLTCIVLMIFCVRYLGSFWYGFISVLVLVTSWGYIHIHVTRTGDYDALLILFTTTSCLLWFLYLEQGKNKLLFYFFIALCLALFAKSIAGLLFVPALFLETLFQKKLFNVLKNKYLYIGMAGFFLPILTYYIARENLNPGYIQAVLDNELLGRYTTVIEAHKEDFWYYLQNLKNYQYPYWILLLPCGLAVGLLHLDPKIKRLTRFLALACLLYMIIISKGETKLEWYVAPLFPFFAMITGMFLHLIFDLIKKSDLVKGVLSLNVLPYLLLFLVFVIPYHSILEKNYMCEIGLWNNKHFYDMGHYLKMALKGKVNLNEKYFVYDGYDVQFRLYVYMLQDKGVKVAKKDWWQLGKGDVVFTGQASVRNHIATYHQYKVIDSIAGINTYEILE